MHNIYSIEVYVYVYVYVYMYMYTYLYMYLYLYMYTCMYTWMYMYMYMYTCTYTYMYMYRCGPLHAWLLPRTAAAIRCPLAHCGDQLPPVVQKVGRRSRVRGVRAVDHLWASSGRARPEVVHWFPLRLPHAAALGGAVGSAIRRRLVARAADPPCRGHQLQHPRA